MGYTFFAKIQTLDTVPEKPRPPGVPPGTKPPDEADDPWYGIDLGLGYLRPTHPIAPGGTPPPVDPAFDIDEDTGYLRPNHDLPVPPPAIPADPNFDIDQILGWLRPTHPIVLPPDPPPTETPKWEVKIAWTPVTGWVVVAVPTGEHVTPSKKR